jgi:proteasome beta subunit
VISDNQSTDVVALLRQRGWDPFATVEGRSGNAPPMTHGTTICAIRYVDGVVMVGDRRATAGNVIAHRAMEKVYPADRHSGVAIAGAAGAAMEMVKLFQLQLEHYEKLEGMALSFEGKANTLAQMVRSNLPAAIQMGMVVVPLFAGYDLRRQRGRIFTYDYTGGRYEETDYQAEGSGGRDARTTIKLGWHDQLSRDETMELAIQALYEAADEDSATGGPDPIRGIYPKMATITTDGFAYAEDEEVAARFAAFIERRRRQSGSVEQAAPPTSVTPKSGRGKSSS